MQNRLAQGHIYLITNTINHKRYVGQTWTRIEIRWKKHQNKNKRGCPLLSRAIAKYGAAAFAIESLIRFSDQETADLLETHFINWYCSDNYECGYNLQGGGQNGRPPMALATRQKISQSRIGMTFSEETKQKMSESHKNAVLSEDGQKRLDASRARKRKLTIEQANQIREEWKTGIQQKELAKKYGVSAIVIHLIILNKTYINNY